MRAAIGLIGLGLIGGVGPTGFALIGDAALVLAGTVGALLSLFVCCLAGAAAARRARPRVVTPLLRRHRHPLAPPQSAPRTI
jgi:hypothetical protein